MTEIYIYLMQTEWKTKKDGQVEKQIKIIKEKDKTRKRNSRKNRSQKEKRHEIPNKAKLSDAAAHMKNSQKLYDLQLNLKSFPTIRAFYCLLHRTLGVSSTQSSQTVTQATSLQNLLVNKWWTPQACQTAVALSYRTSSRASYQHFYIQIQLFYRSLADIKPHNTVTLSPTHSGLETGQRAPHNRRLLRKIIIPQPVGVLLEVAGGCWLATNDCFGH